MDWARVSGNCFLYRPTAFLDAVRVNHANQPWRQLFSKVYFDIADRRGNGATSRCRRCRPCPSRSTRWYARVCCCLRFDCFKRNNSSSSYRGCIVIKLTAVLSLSVGSFFFFFNLFVGRNILRGPYGTRTLLLSHDDPEGILDSPFQPILWLKNGSRYNRDDSERRLIEPFVK